MTLSSNSGFSIIIPHYECKHFLINTLSHLRMCQFRHLFEIIIVDDSSSVESFQFLQHRILRDFKDVQIKLLRWPERQYHPDGTKVFRAGASRHWGVTESQYENIIFLDADILVSPDFFQEVESSLRSADLVQFVRLHIPVPLSDERSKYETMISSQKLYIEEADYWGAFFNSQDWRLLKNYWKYTCTYALAIKKSTYLSAGGFDPRYNRYGFEDTHLGYRVYKLGGKFQLNRTPVLHLTEKKENTQSLFFKFRKQNRLRPMARVFYELNPDSEVFDVVSYLL